MVLKPPQIYNKSPSFTNLVNIISPTAVYGQVERQTEGAAILTDGGSLLKQKKLLKTHATTCALSPAPALGADISQSLLFAGILIVPDVPAVILVRLEESRCDAGI